MNEVTINKIYEVALKEPKSTEHLLLKLMEEVGEASQAYLSTTQASGSQYKELSQLDFQEELVDSLLVILTLIKKTGISEASFDELLLKKIAKWESKQNQ